MIFKERWGDFDPKATNTIAIGDLPKLIRQLEPPMGLKGAPMRWAVRMCLNLGLEHTGGKIAFEEVLNALVSHNYRTQLHEEVPAELANTDEALRLRSKNAGGRLFQQGKLSGPQQEVAKTYAVMLVAIHMRNLMSLKRRAGYSNYHDMREANKLVVAAAEAEAALHRKPCPVAMGEKLQVEIESDPPEGIVWAAATVSALEPDGDFYVLVTHWSSLSPEDPLYGAAWEEGPYTAADEGTDWRRIKHSPVAQPDPPVVVGIPPQDPLLPLGWREAQDEAGRTYFYNLSDLTKTQWHRPTGRPSFKGEHKRIRSCIKYRRDQAGVVRGEPSLVGGAAAGGLAMLPAVVPSTRRRHLEASAVVSTAVAAAVEWADRPTQRAAAQKVAAERAAAVKAAEKAATEKAAMAAEKRALAQARSGAACHLPIEAMTLVGHD